jgi:hypothetical protein
MSSLCGSLVIGIEGAMVVVVVVVEDIILLRVSIHNSRKQIENKFHIYHKVELRCVLRKEFTHGKVCVSREKKIIRRSESSSIILRQENISIQFRCLTSSIQSLT